MINTDGQASANDKTGCDSRTEYFRVVQSLIQCLGGRWSEQEFLDNVVRLFQRQCGCDFVGIRVRDEAGYIPYQSYIGFSRAFWEAENMIQVSQEDCSCTRIVGGKLLPFDMPIINSAGSLCCNDTQSFAKTLTAEQQKMYRGACNDAGYRSVAVIPIRNQGTVLGIIHLADLAPDRISPAALEFVESIAPLVGEVLSRGKVEKSLQTSQYDQSILRSLVAGISALAYVIDADSCELVHASQSLSELYGDDLAGKKCFELFGFSDICADCPYHSRPELQDGYLSWERHDVIHDRYYLLESKAVPWPDGRTATLLFATDVTRQKKAEILLQRTNLALEKTVSELQQLTATLEEEITERQQTQEDLHETNNALLVSDARYRGLFAHMRKAFVYFAAVPDENHRSVAFEIMDVNPSFELIFGGQTADLIGSRWPDDFFGDWAGLFDWLPRYSEMSRKDASYTFEQQIGVRGKWFQLSAYSPEQDRIAVLIADTTEIVRYQERLEYYADEVAAANTELKEFVNTLAHDFRSPMINLKGFSSELGHSLTELKEIFHEHQYVLPEELRAKVDDLLDNDVTAAQNYITASADRLNRMVEALLDMARMGRRETVVSEVDLRGLVDAVLRSYQHQIEANNISVQVGELPKLPTDALIMEQIIGNLVDNAIKYLDPGRRGTLAVDCVENNDEYVLSVTDNGRGVSAGDGEKIFMPFQRAGKQDQPGEGLGLAYVRTLIRRLGGKVWCESELGNGTSIKLLIPKKPARE
ncbi:MAG: ATP-binding protein [Negativicutes bacterium]|nr:ATP-binding protein [Negativicutes bacterium]